jgi:virginiamycin B lyase
MRPARALLFAALLAPALPMEAEAQGRPTLAAADLDPKEWAVPFGARTRPRDPYADPQGRVWFVGQAGNYVAYLDSRTGEFRRFEIEAGTHPHNLVVHEGAVWFTGNRNGRLVRLDPATGALKTWMIPDSTIRDPHTMIFDPKRGVAWFSAQQAGAVGRFDPKTGEFKLWKTGARTRPYGVVIDAKGQPWFDLFGTNKLATIDPATNQLKEYRLPSDSARPRRIAITSDGTLWWGDYTRGYLGRLDPKTGATQEWPMPAGRASLPYAMTTDDHDMVWVAQSGHPGTPATLVGFDTKAMRWSAQVPVGEPGPNTIRHMTFDPGTRQIWFGTDQGAIGRITVPPRAIVP